MQTLAIKSGHYTFRTGNEQYLKWDGARVEVTTFVSGMTQEADPRQRAFVLADDGSYAGVNWYVNHANNDTDVYVEV